MSAGQYPITGFGEMIRDTVRMDAYEQALRDAVRPGDVVLDVGAGTGILTLLACRFGASRVYALEIDDVIAVARQIVAANGMADRVVFLQGLSTELDLPERVDVLVSDLRGILPLFRRHLPSVFDARKRFLRPGGRMIPARDEVWAAVASSPDLFERQVGPWEPGRHGFDMSAARELAVNTWREGRVREGELLTEARRGLVLDYTTETATDHCADLSWTVGRAGVGHGLCVWFDTELGGGARFSNAPGAPELLYGRGFFPWPGPVRLEEGDEVEVLLRADLLDADYVWRWNTRVRSSSGEQRAAFEQSDFNGLPLDLGQLARQAPDFRPKLGAEGQVQRLVLERMDGSATLREIAAAVTVEVPELGGLDVALDRVAQIARRYAA